MQDIETAAPLVVRALQQWYGADPFALQFGLFTYVDPALDLHWGKWNSFKQISRNLANSAIALTGQRDRIQDTAQWWISANAITAVIDYMSVTGDHSYLAPAIENTFGKAPATYRPINTHTLLSQPFSPFRIKAYAGFINSYYDESPQPTVAWILQVEPHEGSCRKPALGILRLGRVDKAVHIGKPGCGVRNRLACPGRGRHWHG